MGASVSDCGRNINAAPVFHVPVLFDLPSLSGRVSTGGEA